mgnify:CR=1 FL=1
MIFAVIFTAELGHSQESAAVTRPQHGSHCMDFIFQHQEASANRRRQQGHLPSNPRINALKDVGCGIDMIALNARGARCA